MKAFVISGERSGVGKTVISLALCSCLAKKGRVQAYKTGMDYLDTSYLSGVTGRPAYNLDSFVQTAEEAAGLFAYGSDSADFSVVEGVRGLFEGSSALSDSGSTAAVAKRLSLPVVLVLNAKSITRSAAAIVRGFQLFDPDVEIAGVILNNASSKRHAEKATMAIEYYCGIPVFGTVPRDQVMEIPGRHLGLVSYQEQEERLDIAEIASFVSECVDVDVLCEVARESVAEENAVSKQLAFRPPIRKRVAVAYDKAFSFYYGETASVLSSLGCEVVYFSPLQDSLPDADGYYFGGGYPELSAEKLSENSGIREEILQAAKEGACMYAEGGGLLYLLRSLSVSEKRYPMCGVFSGDGQMSSAKHLGYVEGHVSLNGKIHAFRGHEFHYSGVSMDAGAEYRIRLSRGEGICQGKDWVAFRNAVGGYTHLMPVSSRDIFRELFFREGDFGDETIQKSMF